VASDEFRDVERRQEPIGQAAVGERRIDQHVVAARSMCRFQVRLIPFAARSSAQLGVVRDTTPMFLDDISSR
jgi:hypothetical protein